MTRPTKRREGSDAELRLECARLVAVFTNGEGDQVEKTEKLYEFVYEGSNVGAKLVTRRDIVRLLKHSANGTQRSIARKAGLSEPYISQILSGEKKPGPKVLDMLGYEAVTLYRRRG